MDLCGVMISLPMQEKEAEVVLWVVNNLALDEVHHLPRKVEEDLEVKDVDLVEIEVEAVVVVDKMENHSIIDRR